MKARRKARTYATAGVVVSYLSTGYSVIWGSYWWSTMLNVTIFGMTCAISGVTWWMSRPTGFDQK